MRCTESNELVTRYRFTDRGSGVGQEGRDDHWRSKGYGAGLVSGFRIEGSRGGAPQRLFAGGL
jgi:hypothetical protein